MIHQPSSIIFATNRPTIAASFSEALRLAGFEAAPVTLRPRDAFTALRQEDAHLFLADARHALSAVMLAEAVVRSPQSKFVLCDSDITPEILRTAVDCGLHGVLSTSLPITEAAEALARIWQGEPQFRFDGQQVYQAPPQTPAHTDFDAEWMFGHAA